MITRWKLHCCFHLVSYLYHPTHSQIIFVYYNKFSSIQRWWNDDSTLCRLGSEYFWLKIVSFNVSSFKSFLPLCIITTWKTLTTTLIRVLTTICYLDYIISHLISIYPPLKALFRQILTANIWGRGIQHTGFTHALFYCDCTHCPHECNGHSWLVSYDIIGLDIIIH